MQQLQQTPVPVSSLFAKAKKKSNKGKGSNKGGIQKKSGFEWASSFTLKPFEAKRTRELASAAAASFERRTGKPLCEELKGVADLPKALWNAPIACVVVGPPRLSSAHDDEKENIDDPADPTTAVVIEYANVAALETVGLKLDEFERFIAPADGKQIDNAVSIDLPPEMKGQKKYEGGYKKKIMRAADSRISDDVTILDAHRWAIEKSALIDGKYMTETIGVAYAWKEWVIGEDTLCKPGGKRKSIVRPNDVEHAVQSQAAAIRELKERQGLGNKDPEVLEAVDELLRLKALLAAATE
jgi:hypothetical protein